MTDAPLLLLIAAAALAACGGAARTAAGPEPYRLVGAMAPADSAAANATLGAIRAVPADRFEGGAFVGDDGVRLTYRLLSPPDAEAGTRYPLVVVFHGAGEIGTDTLSHLDAFPKTWARPEIRARFPAYVLAPQMPERSALYSGPAGDPDRHSRPGPPLDAALELVDRVIATHAVDPARVYAVGFSMGASTTWNALNLRPDLFAAGVPIAGVPNLAYRDRLAHTPIWIVHGNADTANPIGPDRAMFEALRSVEGAEVRFWEFDRMHHGVPLGLLTGDALMEWLFAHSRSPEASP